MKVGFDIHGVLDNPYVGPVFAYLTRCLVQDGHEVHILTGTEESDALFDKLRKLDVKWTHFFSVTDHHKGLGTEISRDSQGRPWMNAEDWNPAKAAYCLHNRIDVHFDDSTQYDRHFLTPFCRVMGNLGDRVENQRSSDTHLTYGFADSFKEDT
jgi:hypothetical protein